MPRPPPCAGRPPAAARYEAPLRSPPPGRTLPPPRTASPPVCPPFASRSSAWSPTCAPPSRPARTPATVLPPPTLPCSVTATVGSSLGDTPMRIKDPLTPAKKGVNQVRFFSSRHQVYTGLYPAAGPEGPTWCCVVACGGAFHNNHAPTSCEITQHRADSTPIAIHEEPAPPYSRSRTREPYTRAVREKRRESQRERRRERWRGSMSDKAG